MRVVDFFCPKPESDFPKPRCRTNPVAPQYRCRYGTAVYPRRYGLLARCGLLAFALQLATVAESGGKTKEPPPELGEGSPVVGSDCAGLAGGDCHARGIRQVFCHVLSEFHTDCCATRVSDIVNKSVVRLRLLFRESDCGDSVLHAVSPFFLVVTGDTHTLTRGCNIVTNKLI